MLKSRRKEPTEELRFPEPREGLPEDPRPYVGTQHLMAADAVQQHLSGRCLVAVTGRLGSGKSTVCRRAANSRWARQWFLQDEEGHPLHRRFWVDLEDCQPGAETQERIARVLGRATFEEALARAGNGKHCLIILDNADQALGDHDTTDTFGRLVACVNRGASLVVSRRGVSDLTVARPWTDLVEVPGFASDDEATELFDQLAPKHAADLRSAAIVAACDRLPLAVSVLGHASAGADLETARLRVGPQNEGRHGLQFALEASIAMLDSAERQVWGALSLFPSGLSADDVTAIVPSLLDPRGRTIRLSRAGIVHRCEAGVRVPLPLRVSPSMFGIEDVAVRELWRSYVRRAQVVVGPVPGEVGGAGPHRDGGAGRGAGNAADQSARGRRDRGARASRDSDLADAWLTRQLATLHRLDGQPFLPEGTFDLASAGLLTRRTGSSPDAVDRVLVRLLERHLDWAVPHPDRPSGTAPTLVAPVAPRLSVTLAPPVPLPPSVLPGSPSVPLPPSVLPGSPSVPVPPGSQATPESPGPPGSPGSPGPPGLAASPGLAVSPGVAGSPGSPATTPTPVEYKAQAAQIAAALEDRRRFGTAVLLAVTVGAAHMRAGDRHAQAEAMCQRGRSERLWSHYEDAENHLAEAHQLYEELGDEVGQGCALFELGQVALDRGRLEDAEVYLAEALELFVANRRPVGEANTNLELVRADLARGRLDDAERRLAEAMDRYQSAGESLGFANASLQLGQVELARGRLESAERRFAGALDGYEKAADKVGFANAFLQLGQVELARGRLDPAERRFGAALAGYQQVGDQVGLANSSLQLGQIDLARGRLPRARTRLLQALDSYQQLGDRIGVANCYLQLGQVNLGMGELDQGDRRLSAARSAYDDIGDVTGSANSRHVVAMLRQAQGRRTDALWLFGEAARLHASIGRKASAGWSLAGAARVCTGRAERRGYAADAVRLLEEAEQGDAAIKLAAQLREPPAKPVPAPEVKRQYWPKPVVPAAEPWPRVPPIEPVVVPVLDVPGIGTDRDGSGFREPDTLPQSVVRSPETPVPPELARATDPVDTVGTGLPGEPETWRELTEMAEPGQELKPELGQEPEQEPVLAALTEWGADPSQMWSVESDGPEGVSNQEPSPWAPWEPGSGAEQDIWSDEPAPDAADGDDLEPALFLTDDEDPMPRKSRFPWSRRKQKGRPPDPPTLPGI